MHGCSNLPCKNRLNKDHIYVTRWDEGGKHAYNPSLSDLEWEEIERKIAERMRQGEGVYKYFAHFCIPCLRKL